MFLATLIPTAGREYDAGDNNPEFMIGILTGVFALLISQFFVRMSKTITYKFHSASFFLQAPTLSLFKYGNYCIAVLQLFFCAFIIILFTPLSFPYKEATAPQRFHVWHARLFYYDYNQNLRKQDNGFYVFPHDRNGIKFIKDEVPLIKDTSPEQYDMTTKCNTEVLCGIPHYHVYYTGNAFHSIWLKAKDFPKFTNIPQMRLQSQEVLSQTRIKYSFQITSGTSHMSLHISPLVQAKIVKWSFVPEIHQNYTFSWNNRDVYFINYVRGVESNRPYEFFIETEKPLNWSQPYTFDIALAAQFIHQPQTHTKEFENFLETFPKWTTLQYFTNYYVGYQY